MVLVILFAVLWGKMENGKNDNYQFLKTRKISKKLSQILHTLNEPVIWTEYSRRFE